MERPTAEAFIQNAKQLLDTGFVDHFQSGECHEGVLSLVSCMRKGLGPGAYDCSGLVVASMARTLGISTDQWPLYYRHVVQLARLGTSDLEAQPGDMPLFRLSSRTKKLPRPLSAGHIGIFDENMHLIHAVRNLGVTSTLMNYRADLHLGRVGTLPFEALAQGVSYMIGLKN